MVDNSSVTQIHESVGSDGIPDGNPETVIIGTPLDGTTNPDVSIGQTFTDITGVIQQQYAPSFHFLEFLNQLANYVKVRLLLRSSAHRPRDFGTPKPHNPADNTTKIF